MMQPVIPPVDRALLEKELDRKHFIRNTSKGGNKIYVITADTCPETMREIGRLREVAFRDAGGGTGADTDIDPYDTAEGGYRQMIVWDPAAREIVGGYRYIICNGSHPKYLSTEHYFRFNDLFRGKYLPYTIELGRSFVQPMYQGSGHSAGAGSGAGLRQGGEAGSGSGLGAGSRLGAALSHKTILSRPGRKGLYALDNLWDGLGALIVQNPHMRYFFGKVTMYGDYNRRARNMLVYFLRKYFPDTEHLVDPIHPINLDLDEAAFDTLFTGSTFQEDYRILSHEIRALNESIPPLINSYMNLSPSMRVFGTVRNPDFGNVEETGILITISDIYPQKSERHTRGMFRLRRAKTP